MQALHVECNSNKFSAFLTKTDRIFTLVCPDLNNIDFDIKDKFYKLVNSKNEIIKILEKTKTNI